MKQKQKQKIHSKTLYELSITPHQLSIGLISMMKSLVFVLQVLMKNELLNSISMYNIWNRKMNLSVQTFEQ